ncbi:MAG: SurA N-terminal domain-containing protein [Desulfovermiculus sp.]
MSRQESKTMYRVGSGLLVVCVFICLLAGVGSAKLVNRIVAVVNGEAITLHDLKKEVEQGGSNVNQMNSEDINKSEDMQSQVLEAMINDTLLEQEAERFEIQVSDEEVQGQIDQIQQENGLSQAEFEQAVKDQGMSMDEYRQALREEIKKRKLLSNMVHQKVVVADDEVQEFYQQNQEDYGQPQTVRLRLIVHPDQAKLEEVREAIVSGETSFAQAADDVSQGPGAGQGGDLGELRWEDLRSEWRDVVSSLNPKEVSQVFSLQDNYALLYLEEYTDRNTEVTESAKKDIQEQLYSKKLENRYKEYMEGLREKAVIDVRLQSES